jgi:hypothetical protein
MTKTAKAGRNDMCHCGSGKKYKKCHGLREQKPSRVATVLLVVVAAVIVGAIAVAFSSIGKEGTMVPGQGRVWSPEHGHWH